MFECNGLAPYFVKMEKNYLRFKYTHEDLIKAIDEITSGRLSLNKASSKYGIPKSTLHNKITKKVPFERKMGPSSVLTPFEEERLESWILAKAKLGFPMHPSNVMDAVQNILRGAVRPKLHWPKQEGQLKKRRTVQPKFPFAITSNKWVEYHNEKEQKRIEKENEIKEKKMKREMKMKDAKVKIDSNKKLKKTIRNIISDEEIEITKAKRKRFGTTDENIEEEKPLKILKKEVVKIGKGDYVLVKYQNKKYPGLVTDIENEEYEVSTMEQELGKKHKWRWPNVPDKIWYKYQNIVKKIPEPSVGGSDGYFYVYNL